MPREYSLLFDFEQHELLVQISGRSANLEVDLTSHLEVTEPPQR